MTRVHISFHAKEALAATHELDNLEAVVRPDFRFQPTHPRKNIQIAFDGHSFSRHANVLEQGSNGEPLRNLAALAIDRNGHGEDSAGDAFERERMVNRISSFASSFRA